MINCVDVDHDFEYSYSKRFDIFTWFTNRADIQTDFESKYGIYSSSYLREIILSTLAKIQINMHDHLRLGFGNMKMA